MGDALTIRRMPGVAVVDITGRIVLGETSKALRNAVADLLTSDFRRIVLNLGAVTYVDSAGIGELVYSSTAVSDRGGKLKMANTPKRVKDLMRLAGIAPLFESYEDEQDALKSFS